MKQFLDITLVYTEHMKSCLNPQLNSPVIIYLNNDCDPSNESDLSVDSDFFETEPEVQLKFTTVPQDVKIRTFSTQEKVKQILTKQKRTLEIAFLFKCNAGFIRNTKKNNKIKKKLKPKRII